jgi:hypothetical protein
VGAVLRAQRQELAARLHEIASKRGLVLFEGTPMTSEEARKRYRRLQTRHREALVELVALLVVMFCLVGFLWLYLRIRSA